MKIAETPILAKLKSKTVDNWTQLKQFVSATTSVPVTLGKTRARATLEVPLLWRRKKGGTTIIDKIINPQTCRYGQIGIVSFGSDCPSQGVYARVTKIKHWIQFIAGGALDTNCDEEIPWTPGLNLN